MFFKSRSAQKKNPRPNRFLYSVCDRCGRPAGTCHHQNDPDYIIQPISEYEAESAFIRFMTICAGFVLAVLLLVIFIHGKDIPLETPQQRSDSIGAARHAEEVRAQ